MARRGPGLRKEAVLNLSQISILWVTFLQSTADQKFHSSSAMADKASPAAEVAMSWSARKRCGLFVELLLLLFLYLEYNDGFTEEILTYTFIFLTVCK